MCISSCSHKKQVRVSRVSSEWCFFDFYFWFELLQNPPSRTMRSLASASYFVFVVPLFQQLAEDGTAVVPDHEPSLEGLLRSVNVHGERSRSSDVCRTVSGMCVALDSTKEALNVSNFGH